MNELSLQGVPGPVVVGASFIVMVLTATAIWRIAVFLKAALIRILPSRAAYNRRRYLMTKSELAFLS